jgi:hypothetical protein
MKIKIILLTILLSIYLFVNSSAQTLPLVYDAENTGVNYPIPILPSISELPTIESLPDPFEWSDGRGRISSIFDWRYRRDEIGSEIQNYEIGEKPGRPDSITASYSGGVLKVNVTKNGHTLTLTSQVILPSGTGPFPAVIGLGGFSGSGSIPSSIFTSRNIAQITFNHNQVTTYGAPSPTDPYYLLYPNLNSSNTGQYSTWAWGVSRLIDGLELVQNDLPIDLKHLAVTGCSWAGKLAIFAGAFDERIALTIGQESGGGGYTTWRVSETLGGVETLEATDYNWFKDAMRDFSGKVTKLPEDHHELMAMVAPRALLVTGNPGYVWLADESGYVGSKAAKEVYKALGIPDRFGYSIVSGHSHCQVPSSQIPEISAFVDKFLLGNDTVNTNVATSTYSSNLSPWITWTTPTLSKDNSLIKWTSLIYPSDGQINLDTSITFRWNQVQDAEQYIIQVSSNPGFTNLVKIDSTKDTVITFDGLSIGKLYYWRVKVESAVGVSIWSNIYNFRTTTPLPLKPQLISATPTYTTRADHFTFKWHSVPYADQYKIQTSEDSTFATVFKQYTTTDTIRGISGHSAGKLYYWRVQGIGFSGAGPWSDVWSFTATAAAVKEGEEIPTEYSISQNYPNPFNPATKIKFALPKTSRTKIIIYDFLGRKIRTLINKEMGAGYHEININASNLPSGIYFYKIQSGEFNQTKKMTLMK